MFICSAHITRRRLICIAAAIAILLFLVLLFCHSPHKVASRSAELPTNEARVAYLRKLGWKVQPSPVETFHLLLPTPLTEPYLSYNQLQKKQGFNLENYCGKQLLRCTYAVTNYPRHPEGVQVNLYLCQNVPVAGDVVLTGEKGFRAGLAYPGK